MRLREKKDNEEQEVNKKRRKGVKGRRSRIRMEDGKGGISSNNKSSTFLVSTDYQTRFIVLASTIFQCQWFLSVSVTIASEQRPLHLLNIEILQ